MLLYCSCGSFSAHNTSLCPTQRNVRSVLQSRGYAYKGKGRDRHGVCMISTTCAILQGCFPLVQGRTEDVGEVKSLYCRVKRQLLGQTLNAAKTKLLCIHPFSTQSCLSLLKMKPFVFQCKSTVRRQHVLTKNLQYLFFAHISFLNLVRYTASTGTEMSQFQIASQYSQLPNLKFIFGLNIQLILHRTLQKVQQSDNISYVMLCYYQTMLFFFLKFGNLIKIYSFKLLCNLPLKKQKDNEVQTGWLKTYSSFLTEYAGCHLKADPQCRDTRELFHARAAATATNIFFFNVWNFLLSLHC